MNKKYDAIIIGAGVIGACVAFELSKKGYKTLSIDKGPEAGYGSTSGSCAIIRTYYSAYETCALAYEGWFYWKDWANYMGVDDEQGLIKYHSRLEAEVGEGKSTNSGIRGISGTKRRILPEAR